jgi:hypothetical protein
MDILYFLCLLCYNTAKNTVIVYSDKLIFYLEVYTDIQAKESIKQSIFSKNFDLTIRISSD